jgi:hypothetical protein
MFLFIRFLPVISIAEMRELVHEVGKKSEPSTQPQGGPAS